VDLNVPEGEFILANINAVGFYRVAYDESMWQMIINKLTDEDHTVSQLFVTLSRDHTQ